MTGEPLAPVFYFDTSALVKRYATETGSVWVSELCQPDHGHLIATAQVTKAEAAAAFAGKHRSEGLAQLQYDQMLQDLDHDFSYQYLLVEIDQALVDLAVNLTKRQKLRGYDAIQLAAALTLRDILPAPETRPLTFIAADHNLLEAAQNEGLLVTNPNLS